MDGVSTPSTREEKKKIFKQYCVGVAALSQEGMAFPGGAAPSGLPPLTLWPVATNLEWFVLHGHASRALRTLRLSNTDLM